MVKNCYENTEVIGMVNKQSLPTDFFLDYAFPSSNTRVTDADKVEITRYTEAQPCMAPYTDPCGPGVALKRPPTAGDISRYAPPTIKLDETITPCEADERRVDPKTGEFIESYSDRMDMEVAEKGAMMRNAVIERLRFTAAQVIQNGGYIIEGENVESTMIDFKRDPKLMLDIVAGGGETWDLAAADPDALLEAITEVMLCYGISGTFDVIYTPAAWAWRKKHVDLDRRDFNYASSNDTVLNTGASVFNYAQFKGTSGGAFNHWLVNQKIKQEDGTLGDMLPNGSIAIVQRAAFLGQRVYGGIRRPDGSTIMQPIWFRDRVDDECDVRKLHLHSRPMLIPGNVNASAWIRVVDPTVPMTDLCPTC